MAADSHQDRLALRLPVRAESVGIGRRAAAQFAEETGFAPATLWRVRLSVSEALSNVVLHAYPDGISDGAHLVLAAEADEAAVHFTISDDGSGLRARSDSPGMGLGLALIANSCDELSLDTGDDGGTIVRMAFVR
jgi:serine/threonine-protein kinase RsbW